MTPTIGSLFAGIGGIDLAFEVEGFKTAWQVEIDPKCRQNLARFFPDAVRLEDVRQVGKHNLAPVDVITFGSPCQDLSIAGKRAGLAGSRSGLFTEAIRIIDELRPAIAIWENVAGSYSSNKGADFRRVIESFAEIGALDIAWRVCDAQYYGVPQRRRRVFVVADFRNERADQILFDTEGGERHITPRETQGKSIASVTTGCTEPVGVDIRNGAITGQVAMTLQAKESGSISVNTVPHVILNGDRIDNTITAKLAKGTGGPSGDEGNHLVVTQVAPVDFLNITSKRNQTRVEFGLPANTLHQRALSIVTPHCIRRLTPTECERLQGFPDHWTDQHADTNRYRMLGNSVAVPVLRWIARRTRTALATPTYQPEQPTDRLYWVGAPAFPVPAQTR